VEAAQPEIASEIALDKAQMAPECTYQDARSEGVTLLRPTSDNTTFHAKSQSIHNN